MSLKNVPYVSLDRVFSTLNTMGFNDLHEVDTIERSGMALEAIGCVNQYEEAVCFVEVKNHQCTIPIGNYAIIQIARNNCFDRDRELYVSPAATSSYNVSLDNSNTPSIPVILDCNGIPIQDYDLAYYRPFFDLQWEYSPFLKSNLYQACFTPVNLTNHSFFNSIVCKEANRNQLYENCADEYNIYGGDTLRFSFKEGQVAIAYNRTKLGEDGLPMLPDQVSYITAISYYNVFKMMEREFYLGRDGAEKRMEKAEGQWQWYCKQAKSEAMMLKGIDEHENFRKQRSYLLPMNNRYHGFFGKLNKAENRSFDNPVSNRFRGYR